jgi:uncharacterized membrane protein YphA (DoxX/SURF4 family)
MWIELFVFLLVFAFAAHQFWDLKREKKKTAKQDQNTQGTQESNRLH